MQHLDDCVLAVSHRDNRAAHELEAGGVVVLRDLFEDGAFGITLD